MADNFKKKAILITAFLLIFGVLAGGVAMVFYAWEDSMWLFANKKTVEYRVTDEAIKNPLMGFAAAATSRSNVGDNSLVYIDITFREFEPEEGKFAFEEIESLNYISRWKSEGKHAVLRFICDYPGEEKHLDIPDWLYEKTGGDGTFYDISYGKGYSPNYNNEVFIEYHEKAIKALGDFLGKDTFVSYVELGSLGHWGEWHVKSSAGINPIPLEAVRLRYITPYIEAFPNAKILMRRPFKAALTYGFGLYNDMVGNPESILEWTDWIKNGGDYDQADEENALVSMENCWKASPIGGEFTSSYAMDWMIKVNIDETVKMIADSHTTFLGPKFPKSTNATEDVLLNSGIKRIINNLGYRYAVTKCEISKSRFSDMIKVRLDWTNDGVAPMYWDWPVYLYVLDEDNNILNRYYINLMLSQLLPGRSVKTTNIIDVSDFKNTNYKLCVGISDPMIDKPAVLLTCDAPRIDNLTFIYQE